MNMPPDDPHRTAEAIERLAVRIGQLEQALAELKSNLSALQANRTEGEPEEVVRAAVVEAGGGEPAATAESIDPVVVDSAADDLPTIETTGAESWPTESGKTALHRLEALIGGRWLTWIGAATMLLAIAFFIPWAWKYFQTPAWFKVLMFHLASWGILGFGLWTARRDLQRLGHAIVGLGLFAWYGTALAALRTFGVYEKMFGDGQYAFAAFECSLITAVAIFLAVRRRSETIILLAAFGGYLNPVLTSSGKGNYVVLFVYLAFLNVGLIVSAIIRGWNFLKPIALLATAFMFLGWLGQGARIEPWRIEWLAVLHAVIFYSGVTLPPIVWQHKSRTSDLATLLGASTGYMALTWFIFHKVPGQQLGLLAGGLALLHGMLFFTTRMRVSDRDRMPRVHLALATFFLTLIAPLQLENLDYLPVAWALEGVVLMGIGLFYRDRQFLVSAVIVFVLAAYRFGLQSETESLQLLIVSLLILLGGSFAWWLPRRAVEAPGEGLLEGPRAGLYRAAPTEWESITGGIALGLGNILLMITVAHYAVYESGWQSRASDHMIFFFWTIDLLVVWMLGLVFNRRAARIYAAVVVWLPVSFIALMIYHGYQDPCRLIFNARFGTLAFLTAVAFAIATGYRKVAVQNSAAGSLAAGPPKATSSRREPEYFMRYVLGLYGCFVLFMAINLEIANYFEVYSSDSWEAELVTYSIVWILFAVAIVIWGFLTRSLFYRTVGLLAFVPILLKVFLVDLSQLDQLARVLATFALGAALLGVSFLYQRISARLLS